MDHKVSKSISCSPTEAAFFEQTERNREKSVEKLNVKVRGNDILV